jgi:hypothetical protein
MIAAITPPHPEPSTAGKVYDDNQSIPTKRRSAQLIQERDDEADNLPCNTGKRLKQSSSSSDDGNVAFPAPSNNLTTTTVSASTDEEGAMVLSLFEKLNSCIEEDGLELDNIEDMIKANEYLINAKCPHAMTKVEAGCTLMEALCCLNVNHAYARDLLYEVVCLGGKATDKCYEYVMDQAEWSMPLNHLLVLLLSGYFPTKKSKFFLDELAEGFDEDEEEWHNVLRVLYKDISLGDNLSCGDVDSTVINNINGLPPLMIGETHAEGGPMEKLLIRFPSTRIICSSCNASKLAWRFSEDHNCCQECVLKCSTCNVLKRRLDHFTEEQSKKEYDACCMECEVLLVCSACKVSKSSGLFSESQKSRGEAAWCDKCEMIYLVCSTCKVLKNKSHHFTKVQRKKEETAVCKECEVVKAPVADTNYTVSVNKIKMPVTAEQGTKGGEQRLCSACNMSKNRDKFSRNQLGKGERARCKECLGN